MKKIISIILSVLLVASLFAGCSNNEKSIDFIYPFSANVKSYDPQIASTSDEYLLIENTFEGLIRIDDEGNVIPGMAEKWDISSDKKTYTFYIRKGMKWNIDTDLKKDGSRYEDSRLEYMGYDFNPDITANDFVFALRRASLPVTDSPLFSSISSIKNAIEIHNGKKSSNSLGVTAVDNYTLKIELTSPDDSFMTTLTTAVAMPCNEEFFKATKGRYGLSTEYTLFNGQFYLKQILESSYLLKKNEQYTGENPAIASELTLKIVDNESSSDTIELLEKGYYDAAFLNGSDTESIKTDSGITYTPYNDTTWAFLLNTNDEVFQSETMRTAFRLGLTRLDSADKEFLQSATNLTPPSCVIQNKSANKSFGSTVVKQDIPKSVELWKKGLEIVNDSDIELTVITTKSMEENVKRMLQGIQSGIATVVKDNNGNKIDFTLKIETMEESELKTAIAKREYDIAFCPFKSESNSALTFLKSFTNHNPTGFDTDGLDKAIKKAESSLNTSYVKSAEEAILKDASIIPMLFETSYYASASGVSGINFHAGTGRVSFVSATRED